MTENAPFPLVVERQHLAKHCADLIKQGHNGKWVCVSGEKILGVFTTPLAAYQAGAFAVGKGTAFLVEKIGDGAS
jgi:hypothetical protein